MKAKWTALLLALALLATGLTGCKSGQDTYPVDAGYLYGMDYIAFEGIGNGIDYVKAI